MTRVVALERRLGRVPEEMPLTHPGYDIESKDAAGRIVRYIEVKSSGEAWAERVVGLTRKQFETAERLGVEYWLYIVERADRDDFKILRIQDPARKVTQFLYDDGWRALAEPEPGDEPGDASVPPMAD